MKNSKKGFTLTEILIVTAIIVILSGAAIAGVAVTIANANARGQHIQQQQGVNWESEAVLKVKNTKVELGNEQIYEESADTPAPTNAASSNDEELNSNPTDEPTSTPGGGGGNTGGNTDGNIDGNTSGNNSGNTNGNTSGNGSGSTSSSVSVTFTGDTIERGTKGSGVMSVTPNSDGSTTVGLLYNQWNDGSVQIWKNSDGTYDIQGVNNGGNVIGNALASTGTSFDWNPINQNKKFTLTSEQVAALESVYGMNID